MGFLSNIKRSKEKSKLMIELIDALKDCRNSDAVDIAIKSFYSFISEDNILGPIIKKYGADYDTIHYLILWIDENVGGWYGGWYNNQYIPVCTFAFSKSLECVLKEYREGSSIEVIIMEVQKLM